MENIVLFPTSVHNIDEYPLLRSIFIYQFIVILSSMPYNTYQSLECCGRFRGYNIQINSILDMHVNIKSYLLN